MSPIPGTGDCALGGHGPFCRRPAAGGERGQDTKVSYPLLRLPNFPLRRSAERSRRNGGREGYGTPQTALRWLFSLCRTGCLCRFAAHDSAWPGSAEELFLSVKRFCG